jgi:lysophospholipase L1-like esterase
MNKPIHFFLFLVTLGMTVFGISLWVPQENLELGPFEVGYFRPKELLGELWVAENAPALDSAVNDTLEAIDLGLEEEEAAKKTLQTLLQFTGTDPLATYFESLRALKEGRLGHVRILHYGDSQLEGDRITMQLRDHLQKKYGGRGFGYVALKPLVEPASLQFIDQGELVRKTSFGRRDTSVQDMKYGLLGSFTELERNPTGTGFSGTVRFEKRNWGYVRARDYETVRMNFWSPAPLVVQVFANDSIYSTQAFPAGFEGTRAIAVPKEGPFELNLQSDRNPRIYGLSFESFGGVHVDNVAMRGASGLVFSKLNKAQLQSQLQREAYSLIILQFGGNVVPYIEDESHAKRLARAAARQVDHIKSLYPQASILYIGPSDMARKDGLEMASYPLIPAFKNALKAEVLARGGAYWDLHDVMGGAGSMVKWVESEPAMAVKDYIHFTPAGAKWVGEQLASVLDAAQADYELARAQEAAKAARKKDSAAAALKEKETVHEEEPVDTLLP